MEKLIHKWEAAGRGKGPFKVVGIFEMPSKSLLEHNPEAYNNQMRTCPPGYAVGGCEVCGTALTVNYLINSSDGNRFAVGCECVKKSGGKNLTTAVHQLNLKRDRELRAEKRRARHEGQLQQQREKNGGKTDGEILQENAEKTRIARKILEDKIILLLDPIADRLEDGKWGFRDDVAEGLRVGRLPYASGRIICTDILAKQAGRRGTDAYKSEWNLIENIFQAAEIINEGTA